jgi:hypothetical protein
MLTQLLSLFKSRMADPNADPNADRSADAWESLFDRNLMMPTNTFLLLLVTWASFTKDPKRSMKRFKVLQITQHKSIDSTEHEFLKIEIRDRESGHISFFGLDRTADKQTSTSTPSIDLPTDPFADFPQNASLALVLERLKKFVASISTLFSSGSNSLLASMVEESSSNPKPSPDIPSDDVLTVSDKASLSLTHTADLMSDSLNISETFHAYDRFMGWNHINSPRRQGPVVGCLIPKNLNLFDFALLADAAHDSHPNYSYLKDQCYFYAALVFACVAIQWSRNSKKSFLSSQPGRYRGVKVQWIDPSVPRDVVERYKDKRRMKRHTVL